MNHSIRVYDASDESISSGRVTTWNGNWVHGGIPSTAEFTCWSQIVGFSFLYLTSSSLEKSWCWSSESSKYARMIEELSYHSLLQFHPILRLSYFARMGPLILYEFMSQSTTGDSTPYVFFVGRQGHQLRMKSWATSCFFCTLSRSGSEETFQAASN